MNFNNTSFPHPVLGVANNVLSEIKMIDNNVSQIGLNKHSYEVKIKYLFEDEVLMQLVKEEKAEFVCEVTCSETLFREIICKNQPEITFEIPRKQVKGKVEFVCLLLAKQDIKSYSNNNFHPHYEGFSFEIEKGDILAYFGDFSFNANVKYEKLKAVSSFMEIISNDDDNIQFTDIDLDSEKIVIKLPKSDYENFAKDYISKNKDFTPIIHSSMVLNALIIAIYNYKEYLEKEKLWALTLEQRFKDEEFKSLSIEEYANIPQIAQILLGNPFKRLIDGLEKKCFETY